MTIFGWDASHYDWSRGSMDLQAARNDGITFFTHKATESTNMQDSYFGQAMSRAEAAGFDFIGAYQVVRTGPSPQSQANYLFDYVNRTYAGWVDNPNFFLQCDLEKWPYDSVSSSQGENTADAIEQKFQRKCVLYASSGQYGNSLNGTSHPLWNANYGSNAAQKYRDLYNSRGGDNGTGWSMYSGKIAEIWQYGSQAKIGSQNTCDANAFRGTVADFAAMLGIKTTAISGEEKSMFLATPDQNVTSTSILYLCDGITSRQISQADAQTMLYNAGSSYGITVSLNRGDPNKNVSGQPREWADLGSYRAAVRLAWGPGYCGIVGQPISMSDEDISSIADQVAAQVPGGMTEDGVKNLINQTTLKVN